ncbi:hypothetical protein [Phytohabitans rumicis]|uniref:Sulfotransferase domain-containing protein n=1 Tax=Phytohabitans rumicis TaxID=1076125 RepID=A0A6V8L0M6_9ACTN|nr:hypothetical protein [Phytohabitans rumicis]GFJ89664.1 hypothetical protein Prum_033060 [Phytohabitans rumicis]
MALIEEYAGYYAAIYEAAARVSGASVVIDSSKHSALAHCLRWVPGLDLRVVHVVRDARGVAYSWTKTVVRPEADGDAEMTRYSPPAPPCCGTPTTPRSGCWPGAACRCGGSGTNSSSPSPAGP